MQTQQGFVVFLGAVLATAMASFQAPVNSLLATRIGVLQANFFSNVVGTSALLAAMLLVDPRSLTVTFWAGSLTAIPPVLWTGGLLGSLYMITSTVAVKRLGALGWVSAAFLGQVLGGALLDHLGLFGLDRVPVGPRRLAGIALLMLGAYLAVVKR